MGCAASLFTDGKRDGSVFAASRTPHIPVVSDGDAPRVFRNPVTTHTSRHKAAVHAHALLPGASGHHPHIAPNPAYHDGSEPDALRTAETVNFEGRLRAARVRAEEEAAAATKAAAEAGAAREAADAAAAREAAALACSNLAAAFEAEVTETAPAEAAAAYAEAADVAAAEVSAEAAAAEVAAAEAAAAEAAAAEAAAAEAVAAEAAAAEAAAAEAAAAEAAAAEAAAAEAAAAEEEAEAAETATQDAAAAAQVAAEEAAAEAAAEDSAAQVAAAEAAARGRPDAAAAAAAAASATLPSRCGPSWPTPLATVSGVWTAATSSGYCDVTRAPQFRLVSAVDCANAIATLTPASLSAPAASVALQPAHPRGVRATGQCNTYAEFTNAATSLAPVVICAGVPCTLVVTTFEAPLPPGAELRWTVAVADGATGAPLPLREPLSLLPPRTPADLLREDAAAAREAEAARRAFALAALRNEAACAPAGSQARAHWDDFQAATAAVEAKRAEVRRRGPGARFCDGWSGPTSIGAGWDPGPHTEWVDLLRCAPEPAVVVGGFDLTDVIQGALGDCYFLAALADVAGHHPSAAGAVLDTIFVTGEHNPEGVFCVRLWVHGAWRHIFMDGTFPARTDAHLDPFEGEPGTVWSGAPNPAQHTYHPLIAARSKEINEFWPALLEKAWAMLHGSYAAVEGGRVVDHFPLDFFYPHSEGFSSPLLGAAVDAAAVERQWAQVREWVRRGWHLTVGSNAAVGGERLDARGADGDGIVRGHAFSVLSVLPPPAFAPSLRLLQLRNPHGKTEWNGAFSDADALAWTPELRAACGGYDPAAGNDGVFFMPFSALKQKFDHFTVTPLLKFASEGGSWHKASVEVDVPPRRGGGGGADWIEDTLAAPQLLIRTAVPTTFTVQAKVGGAIGVSLAAFSHEGGEGLRPAVKDDFYFVPPARAAVRALPVRSVESPFEPVPEGALDTPREGACLVNAINGREGRVGVAVRAHEPGRASLVVFPGVEGGGRVLVTVLCEAPFTLRVSQPGSQGSSDGGVRYI